MPSQDARDELLRCLASSRRRTVIDCLADRSAATVGSLSRMVARRERSDADSDPSAETVQRVYLSLQHVHLPALERCGVIEYRSEGGTVTKGSQYAVGKRLTDEIASNVRVEK